MRRKKGIKILALVLALSTVMGAVAFADSTEVSLKDRIHQLMDEGVDRGDIKDILIEEGYTFERATSRAGHVSEETAQRIAELKDEGYDRAEIHEILLEEGLVEEGAIAFRMAGSWMSEELKGRIEELKEEGVTPEEMKDILESEGFEFSEMKKWAGKIAQAGWMTDELKERVQELRDEGVDRRDMKEILEAEGFEFTAVSKGWKGMDADKLELIKNFKGQGLTRTEIREMLAE